MAHKGGKKVVAVVGSGFVVTAIVRRLSRDKALDVRVAPVDAGLRRPSALARFFADAKPERVVNAWSDTGGVAYVVAHSAEIMRNNTLASLGMYDAARRAGVKKIVNLISNSTYPETENKVMRESDWWSGALLPAVVSIGSAGKHLWALSEVYRMQYDIAATNLVIGNAYGTGDHFDGPRAYALQGLIAKIVRARRAGEPSISIWGTGKPVRDWLYADDLADAVSLALNIETDAQPINIASGSGVSIQRLAYYIREIVGYEGVFTFDTSRPDGAASKVMDISRAKRVLGWEPKTLLLEGLKKTIIWHTENSTV